MSSCRSPAELADALGRRFTYVRLSVTEACNFACEYCLPGGYRARPGCPAPVSAEEAGRLARAFAGLGVTKMRLTGGEPTLRRDLPRLAAAVREAGIARLGVTTNGWRLERLAAPLRAAGVTSLNVSVDSLDPEKFREVTGRGDLGAVLRGIDAALAAGFPEVKVNTVLMAGVNDAEVERLIAWTAATPVTVRFIELMPTGDNRAFYARHALSARTVRDALRARGFTPVARAADAGPAEEYAHPAHRGRVGVIAPFGPEFCAGCNRLRVTADGQLRLCLFGRGAVPLRPWLARDEDLPALQATLRAALGQKPRGHALRDGDAGDLASLACLGG